MPRASGSHWRASLEPAKLMLLRGCPPAAATRPVFAFHVLDAAEAGDHDWMARALGELLGVARSLVIRHVDLARHPAVSGRCG